MILNDIIDLTSSDVSTDPQRARKDLRCNQRGIEFFCVWLTQNKEYIFCIQYIIYLYTKHLHDIYET